MLCNDFSKYIKTKYQIIKKLLKKTYVFCGFKKLKCKIQAIQAEVTQGNVKLRISNTKKCKIQRIKAELTKVTFNFIFLPLSFVKNDKLKNIKYQFICNFSKFHTNKLCIIRILVLLIRNFTLPCVTLRYQSLYYQNSSKEVLY